MKKILWPASRALIPRPTARAVLPTPGGPRRRTLVPWPPDPYRYRGLQRAALRGQPQRRHGPRGWLRRHRGKAPDPHGRGPPLVGRAAGPAGLPPPGRPNEVGRTSRSGFRLTWRPSKGAACCTSAGARSSARQGPAGRRVRGRRPRTGQPHSSTGRPLVVTRFSTTIRPILPIERRPCRKGAALPGRILSPDAATVAGMPRLLRTPE